MDENLRPTEAKHYLKIGLSTFWKLVSDGKIKTIKLSDRVTIVKKSELDRFINDAIENATAKVA